MFWLFLFLFSALIDFYNASVSDTSHCKFLWASNTSTYCLSLPCNYSIYLRDFIPFYTSNSSSASMNPWWLWSCWESILYEERKLVFLDSSYWKFSLQHGCSFYSPFMSSLIYFKVGDMLLSSCMNLLQDIVWVVSSNS